MIKQNCWEFMNCGRGIGGEKVDTQGMCHAASGVSANGLNGGVNGGRICWAMVDADGKDCVRCSGSQQGDACHVCEFRHKVTKEEGLLNVCRALDTLKDLTYNRLTMSLKRKCVHYSDEELKDLFINDVP